jgi:HSP20 family protein
MKTLTMYHPHSDVLQNALSDFTRCFDSFFGDSLMSPAGRILNYSPAVDIQETENSYVMEMELPGIDEKNIEINLDGSNLTIASKLEEKQEKKSEENGKYILHERRNTTFSRSFQLPENADSSAVSAAFKNGILSLNIKKRTESQKRMIQINAA